MTQSTFSALTLDEKHIYRLGERVLPGVTNVIRANVKGWQAGEFFLQRGARIHEAIHLWARGELALSEWEKELSDALPKNVVDSIIGRVKAIQAFVCELGITLTFTEVRLHSAKYGYAGTLDALGTHPKLGFILADWKGTLEPVCCDPQLGGYSLLQREAHKETRNPNLVVAVECHDDGTYKCRWGSRTPESHKAQFDLTQAEATFKAMLTVRNHKAKHKKLEEE